MVATEHKAIQTRYNGYRFRSRLEARWAVFFDAMEVKYEYEKEGFTLDKGLQYLPDFYLPEYNCWAEIKPDAMSEVEVRKAGLLAAHTDKIVNVLVGNPWPGEYSIAAFRSCMPREENTWWVGQAIEREDWYLMRHLIEWFGGQYWGDYISRMPEGAVGKYWVRRGAPERYRIKAQVFSACTGCGSLIFGDEGYSYSDDQYAVYREFEDGTIVSVRERVTREMEADPDYCAFCATEDSAQGSFEQPKLLAAFEAARSARFEHGETPKP